MMSYMAAGNKLELDNLKVLKELLESHGWTWLTAVCVMLFSLIITQVARLLGVV